MKVSLSNSDKIRKYQLFISDILVEASNIDWDKLDKRNMMFVDKMQELFSSNNNKTWSYYCTCLDSMGDSLIAIESFIVEKEAYSSSNFGKQYLMLYGVLNAVYIHQNSLITLSDLVKIKTHKKIKELKELNILFIRNAIGAHPTNFNDGHEKGNFRVARDSLSDLTKLRMIDSTGKFITYNVYKSIDIYLCEAFTFLGEICAKLVNMRYKTTLERKTKKMKILDEIKHGK